MRIEGSSFGEGSNDFSLVTVYDGMLVFEDSAHVVTTTNGTGYDQAESRKTIGVQYANEEFRGKIEVNSLLTSTSTMYVQPVNEYGYCTGTTVLHINRSVIRGECVDSSYNYFDLYYDTDEMVGSGKTYAFNANGRIFIHQ
jgi:hypothetical protein